MGWCVCVWGGGGGGGGGGVGLVVPEKLGGGVHTYPIYERNLHVLLPYLPREQIFDSPFMTVVADTVALNISYKGLLLTVLLMMKK